MFVSEQVSRRGSRVGWLVVLWIGLGSVFWGWFTAVSPPSGSVLPPVADAASVSIALLTDTIPAYGVNFISSAESQGADEQQYANGLATGATWNRWPMYWDRIEQSDGVFSWAFQDAAVMGDIQHGLHTNVILLGTPPFYTTSGFGGKGNPSGASLVRPWGVTAPATAVPQGLYTPVFSDGTDTPSPGKAINPDNRWARFVFEAVNRYKPGGTLAQVNNWPAGAGITHWEIWNEPDLSIFWDGTVTDYARLLKVGYLAAKQADPTATILFGGLANDANNLNFYNNVMAVLDADPDAVTFDYFHDILATHNYLYAWESWFHVWRASNTLQSRGLDKPIWLNESGVPVWDDYPGPICEPDSPFRASMNEQADFIIQSAFYATYAGADAIFFFQLYDGCGNQPGGTDFDWYDVDACNDPNHPKPGGDAFGLYRNPSDAACYRQHPQPETPRPGYEAFRVLTRYFTDVEPLWRMRPGSNDPFNGPQEWIAFYKPTTGERVLGMWARFGADETAVVTATNASGMGVLITPDGLTQTVSAVNGVFTFTLPAATNQNAIWDPSLYPIGGRPFILIESDTMPPDVTADVVLSGTTDMLVSWSGSDLGSGVASYDVAVAVDGGMATGWLTETTAVSGQFVGEVGRLYTFTITAQDRAGNVSGETAVSIFTQNLPEKLFLPMLVR
ncbi:MAG: hypothetical protein D6706_04680 [Chloroflexi bacterium]|nr:MAG: hypothetical protein D6706_04680 [Chloroflexota bacterium]